MLPLQKLVGTNGYEVALFPCQALYLTTARDPDEHDVLGLDFLPRNAGGQAIVGMPCYAPFSGTVVYTGNDHNLILESDDLVNFADGTIGYMRVLVAHSWNAPTQGVHYNQGDLFYTTGNYGQSTGEHLHMEIAKVDDKSFPYWNTGGIGLRNAIHMWDGLFVNNTVLLRPKDYPWKEYTKPTPVYRKTNKFPWVLYARKLRNRL